MPYTNFTVRPSVIGACVMIAGNLAAGLLLYRIQGRSGKSSLKHEGVKGWAVLSREQWMTDTGLSRHQYNDALSCLRKKKLIRTVRPWRNKFNKGTPPTWIKPVEPLFLFLNNIDEFLPVSATADMASRAESENSGTEGEAESEIPYVNIIRIKNKKNQKKRLKASHPVNADSKPKSDSEKDSRENTANIAYMHPPEETLKKPPYPPLNSARLTSEDVVMFWRYHMQKICGVAPVLTGKERKMLFKVCQKIKDEGRDVGAVLQLVMYNWSRFCEFTCERKVLYKNGGPEPNIFTLSGTVSEVLMFFNSYSSPSTHTNARKGTRMDDILKNK